MAHWPLASRRGTRRSPNRWPSRFLQWPGPRSVRGDRRSGRRSPASGRLGRTCLRPSSTPEMFFRPWIPLPTPATWTPAQRRAFLDLARALGSTTKRGREAIEPARRTCLRGDRPGLAAASCVLFDLVEQGWAVRVDKAGRVATRPPRIDADPVTEKARVRRQELLKRDEQLATASVQRFVADMEKPREFAGSFVSVFSLMRDGREIEFIPGGDYRRRGSVVVPHSYRSLRSDRE